MLRLQVYAISPCLESETVTTWAPDRSMQTRSIDEAGMRVEKKFLHFTDPRSSLLELCHEIAERFKSIYPDNFEPRIDFLQSDTGLDLSPSFVSGDVFKSGDVVRAILRLPTDIEEFRKFQGEAPGIRFLEEDVGEAGEVSKIEAQVDDSTMSRDGRKRRRYTLPKEITKRLKRDSSVYSDGFGVRDPESFDHTMEEEAIYAHTVTVRRPRSRYSQGGTGTGHNSILESSTTSLIPLPGQISPRPRRLDLLLLLPTTIILSWRAARLLPDHLHPSVFLPSSDPLLLIREMCQTPPLFEAALLSIPFRHPFCRRSPRQLSRVPHEEPSPRTEGNFLASCEEGAHLKGV